MAVLSRRNPAQFTPSRFKNEDGSLKSEDAPVYIIAPLTWRERALWQADCQRAGAGRFPSDDEVITAARKALHDIWPENLTELLNVLTDYEEAAARKKAVGDDVPAPVATMYNNVITHLRRVPEIGLLMSERSMWLSTAPTLAAAHAIRGWANVDLPWERRGGVVPDLILERIDEGDRFEIGLRAMELMRPSEDETKNSGTPPGSSDTPPASASDSETERAGPSGIEPPPTIPSFS